MMLGITSGRGCATADVVKYLTRSVGADFTKPAGTIYYVRNQDVRSTTREPLFAGAVSALNKIDVRAEVVKGVERAPLDERARAAGREECACVGARDARRLRRVGH